MGLSEQQNLLARLYTDPAVFRRFQTNSTELGAEFGLTVYERDDLSAIAEHEIEFFVDSLFLKRIREVRKLLPLSSRVLGPDFEKLFREFSTHFNPKSVKKHAEDALAFAEFLLKRVDFSRRMRDAVRFESTGLRHKMTDRLISFVLLSGDPRSESDTRATHWRPRLALWIRIGRTSRFSLK